MISPLLQMAVRSVIDQGEYGQTPTTHSRRPCNGLASFCHRSCIYYEGAGFKQGPMRRGLGREDRDHRRLSPSCALCLYALPWGHPPDARHRPSVPGWGRNRTNLSARVHFQQTPMRSRPLGVMDPALSRETNTITGPATGVSGLEQELRPPERRPLRPSPTWPMWEVGSESPGVDGYSLPPRSSMLLTISGCRRTQYRSIVSLGTGSSRSSGTSPK